MTNAKSQRTRRVTARSDETEGFYQAGTLESELIAKTPNVWISESIEDFPRDAFTKGLAPGKTQADSGSVVSSVSDDEEITNVFGTRAVVTTTRMFASLPSSALSTDLDLQASLGGKIPVVRTPPKSINYSCGYVYEYCEGVSPPECAPGGRKDGGTGDRALNEDTTDSTGGGCACGVTPGSAAPVGALFAFTLGMLGAITRRTRRRNSR